MTTWFTPLQTWGAAVADLEERLGVRPGMAAGTPGWAPATHSCRSAGRLLEIIAADPGQPGPPCPVPSVSTAQPQALVGWALACDDIDATVAGPPRRLRSGEVSDGQRPGRGNGAPLAHDTRPGAGGLVPFLISWGDTDHPARSAPRGLTLEAFHLEHPDPPAVAPWLAAVGADVGIRHAAAPPSLPASGAPAAR